MRLLSIILSACILFLTSFGGIVKVVQPKRMDCCKQMAKTICQHHHAEKQKTDNGCDQLGLVLKV